jgi:WhiB family transcriptional regulator, redox-sensing transcriptional regulator
MPAQPWMAAAACRGLTALMFPDRGAGRAEFDAARAVCAGCEVLGECRRWAISADAPRDGIVAGLTADERADLRRDAGARRPRPRRARPASAPRPPVSQLVVQPERPLTAWTRSELLELRAVEG